ncbi:MAG TPA: hypothetical protein VMT72_17795 [Pseudolabrys sp.]|nr:hypothetical protein [Pseudolabrys sp.]
MKTAVVIVAFLLSIVPGHADERFWCLDEGSAGYEFDPKRSSFDDKSKPQNFMRTHTALRLTEQNVYLNFSGLGEKEFSCSAVHDDVIQCIRPFQLFVFDKRLHRFNLAQLGGYVADDPRAIVLRFGTCVPPSR